LTKNGLFTAEKAGRTWNFTHVANLEGRLRELT
jgi:hypothetical protein